MKIVHYNRFGSFSLLGVYLLLASFFGRYVAAMGVPAG